MSANATIAGISLPDKLKALLAGDDPNQSNFRTALFFAILLHLVLAALMPQIPDFTLPGSNRGSILNVFLNEPDEEEQFEQSLNRPFPYPNSDQALLEPTLGSASPEAGNDINVSEATPDQVAQQAENLGDRSAGDNSEASIERVIRTDLAFIRIFARQEAERHALAHPEEVERFRRTFNSRRNNQRRNRSESFKNRYGDYYAKSNSSSGDVCFLQRPGENRDELSTNIVYFYRCDREPMSLDIDSLEDSSSE